MMGTFWSLGFGKQSTSSSCAGGRICAMALAIMDLPVPGSPRSRRWRRWRAAFLATATASSWPMTSSMSSSGSGRSAVLDSPSRRTQVCGSPTLRGGVSVSGLGAPRGLLDSVMSGSPVLHCELAEGAALGRQEVAHHGEGGRADGGADEVAVGAGGAEGRGGGGDGRVLDGLEDGAVGVAAGGAVDPAVLDDAVVAVGEE